MRLLKNDPRGAVAYLNYAKPVTGISPFAPMGPNTLGEHVWPVELSEDGKRVGFSFIAPGEEAE